MVRVAGRGLRCELETPTQSHMRREPVMSNVQIFSIWMSMPIQSRFILAVGGIVDRERLAPIADQEEPAAAASYTGVAGGSRRRQIRTHESRRPFTETAAQAKTCRPLLGFMNNHELCRRRHLPRVAPSIARPTSRSGPVAMTMTDISNASSLITGHHGRPGSGRDTAVRTDDDMAR